MFQTLTYEIKGPTALITFTRPQSLNPLDEESGQDLVNALERAGREEPVRVVVLTGQGKAFSAGGNVKLMAQHLKSHPGQGAAPVFWRITDWLNRSVLAIRQLKKPVIAAVNGVAAGGGLGWVLASDLIIASQKARFDPAYIRIAVCPDGGNTFFLPRLIGPKLAAELFFLGRDLSAERALALGLVNRLAPPDELMAQTLALAEELAQKSPQALAWTKALMSASLDASLAEVLELERQGMLACADGEDFAPAIEAFFARAR